MAEPNLLQSSENPPARPSYILRGHTAQIHAVHFFRGNTRLLTGDASGWIVLWSVSSKRAVAVWRPHTSTILGVGSWNDDKIITHGRDSKVHVWRLREDDEKDFSKVLPIDSTDSTEHKQPWLLHTLPVNALNFCSFSMIHAPKEGTRDLPTEGILLGTPGVQDGSINVTSLPSQNRIATIPAPKEVQNAGMVMAVGLVFASPPSTNSNRDLLVVAGYESGHACIWSQPSSKSGAPAKWQCVYSAKSHAQPALSLDIATGSGVFYTSGADAIIARHPLDPKAGSDTKTLQTKHAGQQGLITRDDEKIFATAGWDGRMRVYSTKGFKELAVLKWHKGGCYAIAFADVTSHDDDGGEQKAIAQRKMTVEEKRDEKARTTHWLAAGSKDGKVSLWDIY
ncbi:ASTRA-associated protein 1 [Cercospora beticola]|uniref:ASTRA-associated protein 1 n=1 Tax=Cercospora beticola TaxID=122368 RepID=A0A2G5H9P2_CERBT|nr:ASTRA-associated protein 1 [Cercospora beticola]PIA89250.1 ASTRA-associated protein 1 [Cercospora beticola]WPB02844.1 hypothetical protein RHO25_007480 [Cercospora beticola]